MIRKVFMSPKAAEAKAWIRLVDDRISLARQVSQLMDGNIRTRIFTGSRLLLESIGSSEQIKEKQLGRSMAYL